MGTRARYFLDALASLDLKLSVSEWVIYRFSNYFKASASTGLSDYLLDNSNYKPGAGMVAATRESSKVLKA